MKFHGCRWLIGVDEVGRGPLAGPVVATAVALRLDWLECNRRQDWLQWVDDSKQLDEEKRMRVCGHVREACRFTDGIRSWTSWASEKEVDGCNILQATKRAMFRALFGLQSLIGAEIGPLKRFDEVKLCLNLKEASRQAGTPLLVDGRPLKGFPFEHQAVVKGDSRHFSIAVASITAKVARDAWMQDLHRFFPQYGWYRNKGYGTTEHRKAIESHGLSPHHRRSFTRRCVP